MSCILITNARERYFPNTITLPRTPERVRDETIKPVMSQHGQGHGHSPLISQFEIR